MEIFHTGQPSCPKTIGLRNQTTGVIEEEIDLWEGQDTPAGVRAEYEKQKTILKQKYQIVESFQSKQDDLFFS